MLLPDVSIKRPIMISMFLIVFVLFGALAYFDMNLELMPKFDLPVVTVQTIYGGASPKEMEAEVTKRIEDAVSPISGIDYTRSYSMENVSLVLILFDVDKDVDLALAEVKDKIDGIVNDLPDDADLPVVLKMDMSAIPAVNLILRGPQPITELHDYAENHLKNRLAQITDVGSVIMTGGQEREIRVEMEGRTVLQHSISIPQLAQILAAQNMDMPGGTFDLRTQNYSVRLKGEFPDLETIRGLEIPTGGGRRTLGELASVADAGAEVTERTIFYNNVTQSGENNVIQLDLVSATDGNAVNIYRELKRELPEIERGLPAGCKLEIVHDSAKFIEEAVKDTFTNIVLGVILTGLVLLFFLHDYKSTIIVALSMPMSIAATFLFMKLSGFSLNMLSLMGLSTAVGILTTNSVVVLENIFRHKEMGHDNKTSASKGTAEIAVAVIASAGTNLVVFLPLATMSSLAGQLFVQFSLTVVYATVFSIIMSFTLTPMLASMFLPEHDRKKHPVGKRLEALFRSWEAGYRRSLVWLMERNKRGWMVLGGSILLFVASLAVAAGVGFEFIPSLDEGMIMMQIELPVGYKLDETAATVAAIEERIRRHTEVSHYWVTLGKLSEMDKGTNLAHMAIQLVGAEERDLTTDELADMLVGELSDIPNAKIRPSVSMAIQASMSAFSSDVEFYLLGPDLDTLETIKREMLERMQDIPGVVNLTTSSRAGKPEVVVVPQRHKLADAGLSIADLAYALRSGVDGVVTTQYKDRGEEYDIRVSLTDETVDSPEKIGGIPVIGSQGAFRLDQLSDIAFAEGYSNIMHRDRSKTIAVTCNVDRGHVMGDVMTRIDAIAEEMNMPEGYDITYGGLAEQLNVTIRDIVKAFIIAVILTYMLLAATLESLTQPLIILGTIPLALIGVFVALALTGISMNIVSMLAIVMLVGIVVNNSILQLDYTNTLVRQRGMTVHDALIEACPLKLKPILMSSVATIIGMLPLAIGVGSAGAQVRKPMGIVSIGGLVVSTVLSLYVIPVLYNIIARKSARKEAARV